MPSHFGFSEHLTIFSFIPFYSYTSQPIAYSCTATPNTISTSYLQWKFHLLFLLDNQSHCTSVVSFSSTSKCLHFCLGWVAQLFGALSCTPKVCGFDPDQENKPRLWVRSPGPITDITDGYFSLTSIFFSFPPFLPLPL